MSYKFWPLLLIALSCFGLGNSWTLLPSISVLIIKTAEEGFLGGGAYATLSLYLVLGAIISTHGATEISRFRGAKKALIYGVLAAFISMAIMAYVPFAIWEGRDFRYGALIAGQVCLGLGVGAILTSATAYLVLFMFKRTAVLLTGMYACLNLGSSASPYFIAKMPQGQWWLFPAGVALFLCILLLGIVLWLPPIHNPYPASREPLKTIFKKLPGYFWFFVLVVILYAVWENSMVAWAPLLLHLKKNLAKELATEGIGIFWGAVAVGEITICALVNKLSPRPIYRLLPFLIVASIFGLVLFQSSSLFFIIGGLGASSFFALTVNFAEKTFHRIAEFISGALVFSYFIGTVLGAVTTGYVFETSKGNLEGIFLGTAFVSIFLIPLSFFLSRPKSSTSSS